jgi:hypothetical protein
LLRMDNYPSTLVDSIMKHATTLKRLSVKSRVTIHKIPDPRCQISSSNLGTIKRFLISSFSLTYKKRKDTVQAVRSKLSSIFNYLIKLLIHIVTGIVGQESYDNLKSFILCYLISSHIILSYHVTHHVRYIFTFSCLSLYESRSGSNNFNFLSLLLF